jgi:Tfp pilus assembly protein PilF
MALDCFEKTITANKKFSLGWSNKAVVYINTGQIDQAEEIIEAAYIFFPKHPFVLNKKGVVLLTKNQPKEALKYFDKALSLFYQEEFLIDRARAYLALSQWKKALEDADRILRTNQKNPDAWLVKAQASRRLHEPSKAKIYEKKAKDYQKKPRSLLED